jgi:hypothetical protein
MNKAGEIFSPAALFPAPLIVPVIQLLEVAAEGRIRDNANVGLQRR